MEKIQSIEQLDALGTKICELLQVGIDKASVVVPETLQQIVGIADVKSSDDNGTDRIKGNVF